jgi:hypothetical protein
MAATTADCWVEQKVWTTAATLAADLVATSVVHLAELKAVERAGTSADP